MPEFYSPLRYPGGKAKLADFLIQVLKDLNLKNPVYVEPYAGGAGAALRLLFEGYVESIVINDLDPRIRCFWYAVKNHNDKFIRLVKETPVTIHEWERQRSIYNRACTSAPIKLGFATFFLNRTTRSGIVHNGGPIGGYDQTGNYLIDARFNRARLASRIERIGFHAERIEVRGVDGLQLLKEVNASVSRAEKTLVYLDPPYFEKGPELYKNDLEKRDHKRLAKYLSTSKRFPWVMTYDDHATIVDLYQTSRLQRFGLSYSAHKRKKGIELLISPSYRDIISKAALNQLPLALA